MHQPRSAERLLKSLSITRPEKIDLEAIAWLQGAKVKYREMDGCEACIHGRADIGRAVIAINNVGSIPRRQRFSLAHELGHWEWHRGQQLICSKEDIGGSKARTKGIFREKGANQFASELLMPNFMLKPRLREVRKFDMRAIQQMAGAFDVSKTAMAYRLVDMDHEPSLLAEYGKEGLRWYIRSKSVDEKWYLRRLLDHQSSAYNILYNGAADDSNLSWIDADTWFDNYGADRYEIGEQSYKVADDAVVSLLVIKDDRMIAD